MNIGLTAQCSTVVSMDNCALTMGSGSLLVFATPSMVALMEKAATLAIADKLSEGQTTVGIKVDISHVAATALGKTVTATAELTAVNGKMLAFKIAAHEGDKLIGEGYHERCIVDSAKFMSKLA